MNPEQSDELKEALEVADADRTKNWIGGAWIEKNGERLLKVLTKHYRAMVQERDEFKEVAIQHGKFRMELSQKLQEAKAQAAAMREALQSAKCSCFKSQQDPNNYSTCGRCRAIALSSDSGKKFLDRLEKAESRVEYLEDKDSCEFCDEGAECCKKFDNSYGEMLKPNIVVCTSCWNKAHEKTEAAEARINELEKDVHALSCGIDNFTDNKERLQAKIRELEAALKGQKEKS